MKEEKRVPGIELKIARIRKGKTQQEVADKFGLTGEYISKLERDLRSSPETVKKIYSYLAGEACNGGMMEAV